MRKPPLKKHSNASQSKVSDISQRLEFLPASRRESIRPVFEKPGDYVLLSLRQIAKKLRADPSTVLRTLRALGFRHFADFRTYLHERVVAFATSSEPLYAPSHSGPLGFIRSSVECDLDNLKRLKSSLEPGKVMTVAKRLWAARKIVVLSGDMTASLGRYLEYTLSMLGLSPFTATTPGEMIHRTRSVDRRDVVLAITYRRGLAHTVEAFQQASRKGAYCVGVSDSHLSPLMEFCDDFFVTSTDRVAFADSYVCGMAFINALLAAMVKLKTRSSHALLKETAEEQRTGQRFYSAGRQLV
jgi:RpiR family transcriptional regulator, carbohydrate utilization regulator